jgi:hypothetical protein
LKIKHLSDSPVSVFVFGKTMEKIISTTATGFVFLN